MVPAATTTGYSAAWTTTPATGQSPCWWSSADWTSPSGRNCPPPTTGRSGTSVQSTCAGTRARWPDWRSESGRGRYRVAFTAHSIQAPGQDHTVICAARHQRARDALTVLSLQRFQDNATTKDRRDPAQRAQRGMNRASREQLADGRGLRVDRAGKLSLGQPRG